MNVVKWSEGRAAQSIYYAIRPGLLVALPRFTPRHWWECDLWAVSKGSWRVHEYEVKLTLADFRADAGKGRPRLSKHERLAARDETGPNRFTFVVPEAIALAVRSELPEWAGLAVLPTSYFNVHLRDRPHVRIAPLLHGERVNKRTLALARRALTYRFWTLHENLVYRDESERRAAETTPMEPEPRVLFRVEQREAVA